MLHMPAVEHSYRDPGFLTVAKAAQSRDSAAALSNPKSGDGVQPLGLFEFEFEFEEAA